MGIRAGSEMEKERQKKMEKGRERKKERRGKGVRGERQKIESVVWKWRWSKGVKWLSV